MTENFEPKELCHLSMTADTTALHDCAHKLNGQTTVPQALYILREWPLRSTEAALCSVSELELLPATTTS
jgi:hypothetical protein